MIRINGWLSADDVLALADRICEHPDAAFAALRSLGRHAASMPQWARGASGGELRAAALELASLLGHPGHVDNCAAFVRAMRWVLDEQ